MDADRVRAPPPRPHGRRLLAVAGEDVARSRFAADGIGAALRRVGAEADIVEVDGLDEDALRAEVVRPFRQQRDGDRALIVSGGASLLDETTRPLWHSTVWQLAGDEAANTDAAVIVDLSDPAHPTRRYSDFCTCDVGEHPLMAPADTR